MAELAEGTNRVVNNILSFDNPVLKHRRRVPRLSLVVVDVAEIPRAAEQARETSKILTAAGHDVATCTSLDDGLELMADGDFDCAIYVGPWTAQIEGGIREAVLLQRGSGRAFLQIAINSQYASGAGIASVRDAAELLGTLENAFKRDASKMPAPRRAAERV